MFEILLMLHLLGLVLGLGGLLCQLLLLTRRGSSTDFAERIGGERSAATLIALVQKPGVYLSIATGVALVWVIDWGLLYQGWLQFKLLFIFWIFLATRLMSGNAAKISALRTQSGEHDSERLSSLKANHRIIGYVTVLTFVFAIMFSLWKPF